jgi:uncharacterized protein
MHEWSNRRSDVKKIWIDLDNSPHVPLFAPIVEELRNRGYDVVLTARRAFQVEELTAFYGLPAKVVGRHYGKNFWLKLVGLVVRATQLLPTAVRERPALAVSHGSRSQLLVCWALRIPSLLIADYEHAKTFALIRPTWVMVPDVIPADSIRTDSDRVLQYPGIKEDVYVPRFRPDPTLRSRLGLQTSDIVVTVRPPATEAHYHNPEAESLFNEVVDFLSADTNTRIIVLPRNQSQALFIRKTWPALIESRKLFLPEHVEDGLNLIWNSDLVISGGGTMNREAAALRVPVYSIFRGPLGAVDRSLADHNRLVLLTSSSDIKTKVALSRRTRSEAPPLEVNPTMGVIVGHISNILEDGAPRRGTVETL